MVKNLIMFKGKNQNYYFQGVESEHLKFNYGTVRQHEEKHRRITVATMPLSPRNKKLKNMNLNWIMITTKLGLPDKSRITKVWLSEGQLTMKSLIMNFIGMI